MKFPSFLLLAPALLLFTGCEETKLYPAKASTFSSPNSAKLVGEGDADGSGQASDQPGGSTSPGVTGGAPSTTAGSPPAAPPSVEPGEVSAGGQAAGSNSGGSSSTPAAGAQGIPPQAPPK